jgi:hypothetical protein
MRIGRTTRVGASVAGLVLFAGVLAGCESKPSKEQEAMAARVEAAASKSEMAANKAEMAAKSAADAAQRAEASAQRAEAMLGKHMRK